MGDAIMASDAIFIAASKGHPNMDNELESLP